MSFERSDKALDFDAVMGKVIPEDPIGHEVAIANDNEIEVIFPADPADSRVLMCSMVIIDSDIPIFYSKYAGGTSAPGWQRLYCRTDIGFVLRKRIDRLFIKTATPGETGNVYFTLGN